MAANSRIVRRPMRRSVSLRFNNSVMLFASATPFINDRARWDSSGGGFASKIIYTKALR